MLVETFYYGFLVPILPYMLENRNHVDFADIQKITYQLLMCYAIVTIISSLFIGPLADRCQSRKAPFILSQVITFVGTAILAVATSCM